MASESRTFRLPPDIEVSRVAEAVEAFLSSSKGMETQSAEIQGGYVVQGRQNKSAWKTLTGMRLAITVQMTLVNDSLTVTAGEGEWMDKIGVGAVGAIVFFPLLITAGVGAYQQNKLPDEIFQTVQRFLQTGAVPFVTQNAAPQPAPAAAKPEATVPCPVCQAPCRPGAKFCESCGAPLENNCKSCGAPLSLGAKFCPECGQSVQ